MRKQLESTQKVAKSVSDYVYENMSASTIFSMILGGMAGLAASKATSSTLGKAASVCGKVIFALGTVLLANQYAQTNHRLETERGKRADAERQNKELTGQVKDKEKVISEQDAALKLARQSNEEKAVDARRDEAVQELMRFVEPGTILGAPQNTQPAAQKASPSSQDTQPAAPTASSSSPRKSKL